MTEANAEASDFFVACPVKWTSSIVSLMRTTVKSSPSGRLLIVTPVLTSSVNLPFFRVTLKVSSTEPSPASWRTSGEAEMDGGGERNRTEKVVDGIPATVTSALFILSVISWLFACPAIDKVIWVGLSIVISPISNPSGQFTAYTESVTDASKIPFLSSRTSASAMLPSLRSDS
ncbi:hypothetical protein D3C71_1625680 [compost metagenome]